MKAIIELLTSFLLQNLIPYFVRIEFAESFVFEYLLAIILSLSAVLRELNES
jgi:hypothetical protein